MQVSSFPLSVANVRKLKKQLTVLRNQLRDDLPTEIEREVGDRLKWQVIFNVPTDLRDVDGNYLGVLDAAGSVTVEKGFKGHDVIWRGGQIAYIEFGTGAAGASGGYPGVMAAGYHPDPTKAQWVYNDIFYGPVLSRGLTPQAPMFNAAAMARSERWLQTTAAKMLKARVTDALTV